MILHIYVWILLLLVVLLDQGYGWSFEPGDPSVKIVNTTGKYITLSMDENNEVPTTLLTVTEAEAKPIISVVTGNPDITMEVIDLGDEKYNISLHSSIDYEAPESHKFVIGINVGSKSSEKYGFSLEINNLNDNKPVIGTPICKMPENTTILMTNATCSIDIHDKDGNLSKMKFFVSDSSPDVQESKIFILGFNTSTQPDVDAQSGSVYMYLQDRQLLDFETITLYIFKISLEDKWGENDAGFKAEEQAIVHVIDIPDMPPVFLSIIATQKFPEEEEKTFQISAKDGDVTIGAIINYKLNSKYDFTHINLENGKLTVDKIDRDTQGDTFTFSVIAYERDDPSWQAEQAITFIVTDIDDNCPILKVVGSTEDAVYEVAESATDANAICPNQHLQTDVHLKFPENFLGPISTVIDANDIDEGDNAKYHMCIIDTNNITVSEAIEVIPQSGYQEGTFSFQIINSTKLDYEDKNWRSFQFQVKAVETIDKQRNDFFDVYVQLTDVNDNPPVFQNTPYNPEVNETATKGYKVITVTATDKDEGDTVRYNLVGAQDLAIDSFGAITTAANNTFDFEKLEKVTIQVVASDDNNTHQTFAPIYITVIDVNDETPVLSLTSGVVVPENTKDHVKIGADIRATDADKGCLLKFSIDWEQSYAKKNYGNLTDDDFDKYVNGIVNIDTNPHSDDVHLYTAELSINEIHIDNTPDYEKFDSLYLKIRVTDLNQEVNRGYDEGILFISIKNVNDNPPQFTDHTKNARYMVTEKATVNTTIDTLKATDIDGDNITYSITKFLDEDTKEWISLDADSGNIYVKTNSIDADIPKDAINLKVAASDTVFLSYLEISIKILDTNDKTPHATFQSNVELFENATQDYVVNVNIVGSDADRDEPYHTLHYEFEQKSYYFRIDPTTGAVTVNLQNGSFDRDYGAKYFDLPFFITDNPSKYGDGRQNKFDGKFRVTLLDCNTQTPKIKDNSLHIVTSEDLKKDSDIKQQIEAEDADEGDNAKVKFEIMDIIPLTGDKKPTISISTEDYASQKATLQVSDDLRDYYGNYTLKIKVTDFGQPPLSSTSDVTLTITKYIFEKPVICFPEDGKTYYLKKEQKINTPQLIYYNDTPVRHFEVCEVVNERRNKWQYDFGLTQLTPGENIFKLSDIGNGNYIVDLELQKELDEHMKSTKYELKLDVKARSEGESQKAEDFQSLPVKFNIAFYDLVPPHFKNINQSYSQQEQNEKMKIEIEGAEFDVDLPYEVTKIYVLAEASDLFEVNEKDGTITLRSGQVLDFDKQQKHDIKIRATISKTSILPDPLSTATITINVIDINNHPPKFEKQTYYHSIKDSSAEGGEILTVKAIDLDTVADNGQLVYEIKGDIKNHTKGTADLRGKLFEIDEKTGSIKLLFKVFNTMSGYFVFNVLVTDSPPHHTDTAEVHIYIISQINLVEFNFENNLHDVDIKQDMVEEIFTKALGYDAKVDSLRYNDTATTTVAGVYFMDSKKNLIQSSEIMKKVTDMKTFKSLRTELQAQSLILKAFDSPSIVENIENILKAWLIGVSVVLGTICMILLVAFILKTRALSRRIKNLTVHQYGSQESGLNRIGVNAPTTNRHAIEGSNPVYTISAQPEKDDIDQTSIGSGDSDLVGIEDNPEFNYEVK